MLTLPLSTLISQYTNNDMAIFDNELNAYNTSQTLNKLLERSICSDYRLGLNFIKSHQYCIDICSLNDMEFYCKILKVRNDLLICTNFEEILKVLYYPRQIGLISGFGSISIYDAALRFGISTSVTKHPKSGIARQAILPNHVYIHNGSEIGAKNLFKSLGLHYCPKYNLWDTNKEFPYFDQNDFPTPFNHLSSHHTENFLCIFENQL